MGAVDAWRRALKQQRVGDQCLEVGRRVAVRAAPVEAPYGFTQAHVHSVPCHLYSVPVVDRGID
jgi:hypothetical protein